jgi:hypothetical protein
MSDKFNCIYCGNKVSEVKKTINNKMILKV